MNPQFDHVINRLVRWLVVLGCFTLPYTHLKWMPDLGTTRPLSLVFFALAFGALLIRQVAVNRLNLRAWWHWPATWDGWPMLRWWLGLLALGAVSAAITPLYGLPVQALTRLLGYMGIFITLFFAAYSVPRYGIQTIARWIFLGYLPVLVYALLEMAGALSVAWATDFVLWFRDEFLVPFHYGNRVALMTTEPSLVAFQMLLLCLLVPYVAEKWLRWCGIILIVVILGFTLSGTVYVLAVIYFGLWFLFSLRRRNLIRLTAVTAFLSTLLVAFYQLIPGIAVFIDRIATAVFSTDRLSSMTVSATIRLNYLLNLVYALIETRGLGLGIGQYGYFWRDIYLRHIDYTRFDRDGEMWAALFVPGDYMKPYSAILGIGVDLGLFGLALLAGFFWQVYRALSGPRLRALFFACLAGLAGAYPIVTPHIWLALGLMTAFGVPKKVEKDPH
jgi:hypothetical protein